MVLVPNNDTFQVTHNHDLHIALLIKLMITPFNWIYLAHVLFRSISSTIMLAGSSLSQIDDRAVSIATLTSA